MRRKKYYLAGLIVIQSILVFGQINIDTRKVIEGKRTFFNVKIGPCECESIAFSWKILPIDRNNWNNVAAQVGYSWQPKAGTDKNCLARANFKYVSLPIKDQYGSWGLKRMYINTVARETSWPPDFNWNPTPNQDEFTWFNLFCKKKRGPTNAPDYDGASTIAEVEALENKCGCWHEARAKKLWNTRFAVDSEKFVYWVDESTDNKGSVISNQSFPDFPISESDLGLEGNSMKSFSQMKINDGDQLISCKNGLQVKLSSEFLGSCESQTGNGVTGFYHRYKIEVQNSTGSTISSPGNFYFYGKTPLSIKCIPNNAGESYRTSGTHSIPPNSTRQIGEFDLMFYDETGNDEFMKKSILQLKNVCGSSGALSTPLGNKTATGQTKNSSVSYSKDQDKIATAKRAEELEKAGRYEEAKKVWDQYETRHPEDSELATSKRRDIHSNMNNNAQAARNAQEKKSTAELSAAMLAFGVVMYKGTGEDKSDKNKYADKSWRLNFTCGYSLSFMPVYMNSVSSIYTGSQTVTFYEAEKKQIGTVNLDLGFQYWPYYGKNAGIGLIADGYGGYIPIGGSTFSYLYQYGLQAYGGLSNVKLLGSYSMGDKGFSTLQKFATGTYDDSSSGEGAARFTRIQGGLRFSFNTDTHPVHHLDVSYVMEKYPNMKQIDGSGINIAFSGHNRLRIYAEYMFKGARIGIIEPDFELEAKNTGSYIRFGVIRSMDWFKQ